MAEKIRLQKYFSDAGIMSRRAAEREIEAGNVKVNGVPAHIGDSVTPGTDKVVWNGRGITPAYGLKTVVALNKPRGYVCTASDEKGRKNVTELVAAEGKRLYPIGRLDMASEGLILLTDDGELANLLTHPKHCVPKVYRVSVKGTVDEKALSVLRSPLLLEGEERPIEPVSVTLLEEGGEHRGAKLEMVLYEGRNRQIRKMCEAARLEVARLRRIRIGNISVNGIAPGTYRKLGEEEIAILRKWAKSGIPGTEFSDGTYIIEK
ncbi:MAG: rRNA pseudouridine synthase [Clostridia bacterium]|nr:rRNA pseudouridine synthase [Clostridia bacterium]